MIISNIYNVMYITLYQSVCNAVNQAISLCKKKLKYESVTLFPQCTCTVSMVINPIHRYLCDTCTMYISTKIF